MKTLQLQNPAYQTLEQEYQYWLQALNYNPETIKQAPLRLREFFYWLEQHDITSLNTFINTPQATEHYSSYLSKRPNKTQPGALSHNYLRIHHTDLNRFCHYLLQAGKESFTIHFTHTPKTESHKTILTLTEIGQLYQSVPTGIQGIRDRAMLAVYYGCGLRKSEGAALQINDIKTDQHLIHVQKGKNNTDRYVPMSRGVSRDINQYIQQARPLLLKHPKEQALFVSQRAGKPLQAAGLTERFKILANTSGLKALHPHLSLHTLRHSIATHLLQAGMKLEQIRTFLGHKSLESTQIYTHIHHGL